MVVCLCLAAGSATAAVDRPETVSPGARRTVETAPALCPTFSWGGVEGAGSYEIVVYEISAGQQALGPPEQKPTLATAVTGSASSWTPPADRCLDPGATYVWFVRGLDREGAVSEWSEGGMFRTQPTVPSAQLEETIARLVRRHVRTGARPETGLQRAPTRTERRHGQAAEDASTRPSSATRAPYPPAAMGLHVEIAEPADAITYGVYGISSSSADDSSGVIGFADTAAGAVNGVAGYNRSNEGRGLFAENNAQSGGIAILAHDEPATDTELSAGVAAFTENPNGFAGFFANRVGGIALAVADVDADIIKFSVNHDGRVEVAEVVGFAKTDTPPGCDGALEGAIYYDDSENWLCICTETDPTPAYGWRRADTASDDCST